MAVFRMKPDERLSLIEHVPSYRSEVEKRLNPIESLKPGEPAVFISVGGGELGTLAVTATKRYFRGQGGMLKSSRISLRNRYFTESFKDG